MKIQVLVLILATLILTHNLDKPFIGHHDWNSNVWTTTAKNNLTWGWRCTKGGQAVSSGAAACADLSYYQNHPPLISWLLTIVYKLLGFGEWAGRLPIIWLTLGSVYFFYRFCREGFNQTVAVFASLFLVTIPIFGYYGKAINHEPLILFGVCWSVYAQYKWLTTKQTSWFRWYWLSAVYMGLAGWHGYLLYLIQAGLGIKFYPRWWRQHLWPVLILVVEGGLHILHSRLVLGYWPVTSWFYQLLSRMFDYQKDAATVRVIPFSYEHFFRQQLSWLKAFYGLIPWLGTVLLAIKLKAWRITRLQPIKIGLLSLGLFGAGIPLIFAQQAFIHDYLNLYLAPIVALGGGYMSWWLSRRWLTYHLGYWIAGGLLVSNFLATRPFYLAIDNSTIMDQYFNLAAIIYRDYPKASTCIITSKEFFDFARPVLQNYAFGCKFMAGNYTPMGLNQLVNQLRGEKLVVDVAANPALPETSQYLQKQVEGIIKDGYSFYDYEPEN